ncbi:MAG: trypsin-like peptidase domain-containing protein [Candidatus Marinimicrobia bacterium]|nr:trypsin-like peptidase domain-containing protein [Candidatus Neomarinimicrobiota bacterium]
MLKDKRLICITLILMTVISAPAQFIGPQKSDNLNQQVTESRRNAITNAIEKCVPAVVGIHVTEIRALSPGTVHNDPLWNLLFPGQLYKREVKSMGSGVIISDDGYIITNAHVVGKNAVKVIVTLSGGARYPAEVVGVDDLTDISLLKIEAKDLPNIEIGDSDDVIIGEWVVALGNPFGLFDISNQPTATIGIVSSKNVNFGEQAGGRVYQEMIQTDASINSGNSGGALVNVHGEMIGINTFIFTGGSQVGGSVGVGFAIPVNRMKTVVDELIRSGYVERGFETGLSVQTLDQYIAAYLNLPFKQGVIVTDVRKNSSAHKAGLKVGDIIRKVNDIPITNTRDIYRVINENYLKTGDVIHLEIWRNQKIINSELVLAKPSGRK